jgi:hypothetical protein
VRDAAAELRAQQMGFAAHVREPSAHAAPEGIEDRRMAIYRDLFFNSIEGLLAGNFPVIHATLGDEAWRTLVRGFYAEHRCATPLFTEVGREFVEWLAQRDSRLRGNGGPWPAWLPELAHYEWVELALQIAEGDEAAHDPNGDMRSDPPVLSALAWPLAYRWPVNRIGPEYQPDAPPDAPTLLLVRRDPAGDVRFSALSPLAYRLLELIDANDGRAGDALLRTLATEAGAPSDPAFLDAGADMLQRLRDEGVLLGTRPRC